MPRHLLVPFDDSELSDRALTFACSTFPEDRITVMYVIDSHSDDTAAIGGEHDRPVRTLDRVPTRVRGRTARSRPRHRRRTRRHARHRCRLRKADRYHPGVL
ncbi:hypothetical protein DU502_01495 [Haloplanus aerogenes]|uniref:UspA domain-containing protein n=1 Tax=Haloplanus aerogenes TaxID=660522 RepID=A0A3G8QRR2_9EURY|nr:hypothetical protein DU502_01495 [Haloplanus aerogenes]